jgi:glycosyltransferase involved in cell wall biosynthesis
MALIIPVLNEGATIAAVVRTLPSGVVHEVIVADGGSSDNTVEEARAAGARVLIVPGAGYGAACLAGVEATDCSVLVFIDGDGSDDPAQIPDLIAPIVAGEQDFVIGSRVRGVCELGSMGFHQLLAGRLAGLVTRALYGVAYTDMGPLRAIRRDALLHLGMREKTYGWNLEMQMRAARDGLRILELPAAHRNRAGGESKVAGSLRGSIKAAWHILSVLVRTAVARR